MRMLALLTEMLESARGDAAGGKLTCRGAPRIAAAAEIAAAETGALRRSVPAQSRPRTRASDVCQAALSDRAVRLHPAKIAAALARHRRQSRRVRRLGRSTRNGRHPAPRSRAQKSRPA